MQEDITTDEQNSRASFREFFPWHILVPTTLLFFTIVGLISYAFSVNHKINRDYLPVLSLAHQIKQEATSSHLWMIEVHMENPQQKQRGINVHLNNARKLIKEILNGPENWLEYFSKEDEILISQKLKEVINATQIVQRKLDSAFHLDEQKWQGLYQEQGGQEAYHQLFTIIDELIFLINHAIQVDQASFTQTIQYLLFTSFLLGISIFALFYINYHRLFNLEKERALAFEKAKILSGLLPICANCKMIRNDKGYWTQIESYIESHSLAEFSHCMCDDCTKKLYGHEEWFKKAQAQNS